jgi:hypothetical protein
MQGAMLQDERTRVSHQQSLNPLLRWLAGCEAGWLPARLLARSRRARPMINAIDEFQAAAGERNQTVCAATKFSKRILILMQSTFFLGTLLVLSLNLICRIVSVRQSWLNEIFSSALCWHENKTHSSNPFKMRALPC